MKCLLAIILVIAPPTASANEDCLFSPCAAPPTNAEIQKAVIVFKKAKYILGASFDLQNKNNESTYKNIPDFVKNTKKLKSDIKALQKQTESLHQQLGSFQLNIAISNIDQCVSFNPSAIKYCSQALTELKNYHWEQNFGTSWSDYPVNQQWAGFPSTL